MKINSVLIHETNFVTLLGKRAENVCCQANFKLHALCKIRKYQQKSLDFIRVCFSFLVHLFISQFSEYFAMSQWNWLLQNEKVYYRALKVVDNCEKLFDDFLSIWNEVWVYERVFRGLVMEVSNSLYYIYPESI